MNPLRINFFCTQNTYTELIIHDAHEHNLHGGVNSTVINIHHSMCESRHSQLSRNLTGRSFPKPDPPSLLYDSIRANTVTEVDFLKDRCMTTTQTIQDIKTIYLEKVPTLTEDCFILALRRFSSRQSLLVTMTSDNATTRIAASKEIFDLTHSKRVYNRL